MTRLTTRIDDQRREVLATVPELRGVSAGALDALAEVMQLHMYPRSSAGSWLGWARKRAAKAVGARRGPVDRAWGSGDPHWIHAPGQDPKTVSLAVVVDGRVRLSQLSHGRVALRSLGPGTMFGEQGVVARSDGATFAVDAEPLGRAWVLEAQPADVERVLARFGELRERVLRGFEAARVAPQVVDALKRVPELRRARLDHLYALAEGAEIRTAAEGETLEGVAEGQLVSRVCVLLRGRAVHRPAAAEEAPRPVGDETVIGLSELVRRERVSGAYVAQESLHYLQIPALRFESMLLHQPDFLRAVRDGAGVDPLEGRSSADASGRAGAEVLLLVAQPGVDVPLGPLVDVMAEAIGTHLYDRVCVLHLVAAGADAPAERSVRAKVQDVRYRPGFATTLHRWVSLPSDPAAARAAISDAVTAAVRARVGDEYAYDVVCLDPCRLPGGDGLGLADLPNLTRVGYLHTDPEQPLPAPLIVSAVEIVPIGLLGVRRDLYPFGEMLVSMGGSKRLPDRASRLARSVQHYSRARAARLGDAMGSARRAIEARRGPFDLNDPTVGSRPAWSPRTVRVRIDAATRAAWRAGSPDGAWRPATLPEIPDEGGRPTPLVEAVNRLARGMTGRRVALALGGGGAFGYVHAGLIGMLSRPEYGIPIDMLSGSSFGTVVGTYYAAGDTDFARLKAHPYFMTAAVSVGVVSTAAMTTAIDLDLGKYDLNELDLSLFPVVTDADTGHEDVVRRGTIGYGVRASGSLPPFAPTIQGDKRLLDGGLAANVPVQVLADEGAGLIVSSNPIPDPEPRDPKPPLPIPGIGAFLRMSDPRDRLMDGIRATLILMRAASGSQERFADVRYLAETRGTTMFEFQNVDKILRQALEDPEGRLLSAVEATVEAWRARLNHPPARVRLSPDGYIDLPPGLRFEDVGGRLMRTPFADTLLKELGAFLVSRPDLRTIEIVVAYAAVQLEEPGTKARAEEAAGLLQEALVRAQVAKGRLEVRAAEASPRGRPVDFFVRRRRLGASRGPQVDEARERLLGGAQEALRKKNARLARLLALEAARLDPDTVRPDVEAVLRDVLDVAVCRLYRLELGPPIGGAAFCDDGRWLALVGGDASGSRARVHDAGAPERFFDLDVDGAVGPLLWAAWSPDGERLAAAGHPKPRMIHVWDTSALDEARAPAPLARLPVGDWAAWGVRWSPDAPHRLLGADLSVPGAPAAALWRDLAAPPIRLVHAALVRHAEFGPRGDWVATASADGRVGLWDGRTGAHRAWLTDRGAPVTGLAWHPQGGLLAVGRGREVRVWRVGGADAPVAAPVTLGGFFRNVSCVGWSADGHHLAAGARDRTVRLWNVDDWGLYTVLAGHAGTVRHLAFHPQADLVATSAQDTSCVWSAVTGTLRASIAEADATVQGLSWSPDGTAMVTVAGGALLARDPAARGAVLVEVRTDQILSVGWDPSDPARAVVTGVEGAIELWRPETGALEAEVRPAGGGPGRAAWWPAGGRLATTYAEDGQGRLRILDVAGGSAPLEAPLADLSPRRLRWSPDGARLLVEDDRRFWVFRFDGAALALESGPLEHHRVACAWSPDGRRLATTRWAADESVFVWDLAEPYDALAPRRTGGDAAWAVAWSSDGARLASVHNDGGVFAFVGADERRAFDATEGAGHAVAFRPGSTQFAVGAAREVRLYDSERPGAPVARWTKEHTGLVRHLAWSPDGRRLASGGEDGRVRIWDPEAETGVLRLRGYHDAVRGLAWRSDGRQLLSWSDDATVRVHPADPQDVLQRAGTLSNVNEMTASEWAEWMPDAGARRPTWPFPGVS